MKVNKIFHWLYFLMLLLPIFAIPMYAIYVRNENSTFAQEIIVQENKVVDFNQLVSPLNNGVSVINGITVTFEDNDFYLLSGTSGALASNVTYKTISGISNHVYYLKDTFAQIYNNQTWVSNINEPSISTWYKNRFVLNGNYDIVLRIYISSDTFYDDLTFYPQLFDLTQMFGFGNEPSIETFDTWYTSNFYSYTLSDKQLLKDYDQTTYNDTDVGSQFIYTIYNSIDKYFNYDKVFNFGYLYDWLQLNFFNGNGPIGFFIFWHYLIYFLLTSLLWLLFDVLMYVPNFIHKWLDKAS